MVIWPADYQERDTIIQIRRAQQGKVMAKRGLYANIHAKRKRIAAGSGEKMRKPGAKGAPTNANFKRAAKTAKEKNNRYLVATRIASSSPQVFPLLLLL